MDQCSEAASQDIQASVQVEPVVARSPARSSDTLLDMAGIHSWPHFPATQSLHSSALFPDLETSQVSFCSTHPHHHFCRTQSSCPKSIDPVFLLAQFQDTLTRSSHPSRSHHSKRIERNPLCLAHVRFCQLPSPRGMLHDPHSLVSGPTACSEPGNVPPRPSAAVLCAMRLLE